MTDLASPGSVQELYEDRGAIPLVPVSIPLMQGDVFENIIVPGLTDDPLTVMVTSHPCSMRRGAKLASRVSVAPVIKYERVSEKMWQGHGNVMLLPSLKLDDESYAADFRDITSVGSGELTLDRRIAVLSADGLLILQQRSIYFWTRLKVPLKDLEQQAAPIIAETELLRDWMEEALAARSDLPGLEVAAEAESEFHSWLDENNRERRQKLQQVHNHASLRRESRRELAKRYE